MRSMVSPDDVVIRAPKIAPFDRFPRCPACHRYSIRRWQNFLRALRTKQPIFAFQYRFCQGAKEPTEPNRQFPGAPERENRCAGIDQAHLHVFCQGCGYEFFMEPAKADLSGI